MTGAPGITPSQGGAARDPHRYVSLWLGGSWDILTRIAPIMRVVRDAAGADPDMAAQWQTNQQQRATAFQVVVQHLADLGVLKPGLTAKDALDILLALNSIEVFLILTERGGAHTNGRPG